MDGISFLNNIHSNGTRSSAHGTIARSFTGTEPFRKSGHIGFHGMFPSGNILIPSRFFLSMKLFLQVLNHVCTHQDSRNIFIGEQLSQELLLFKLLVRSQGLATLLWWAIAEEKRAGLIYHAFFWSICDQGAQPDHGTAETRESLVWQLLLNLKQL